MADLEQLILELKRSVDQALAGVQRLEQSLNETRTNLEHLMVDVVADAKESLERELHEALAVSHGDGQGGAREGGPRWSSRMVTWVEGVDTALQAKDREIGELKERLAQMERSLT